jgi:VanZ family protein
MNLHAMKAIYRFEMARTWRTLWQSIVSPVISTSLYFVVFGAAIGSRMQEIDGIAYGAFIEIVQTQIPSREGDWADLAADMVGVALGLAFVTAVRRVRQ